MAEDGSTIILHNAIINLAPEIIKAIIDAQKQEIQRRIKILRGGRSLPEINSRVTILIDDGIAMGSTMRASVNMCSKFSPAQLIVASPVGSPELVRALTLKKAVDEVVILEQPKYFRAVAQVYQYWRDIPDHEVLKIMGQWQEEQLKYTQKSKE